MSKKTKTVCQNCGDGYSNEAFELGMCCGFPLIEVPKTFQDRLDDKKREEAIKAISERAKKLDW